MEIIVAPYHMHRSILLDKRSRDPFYDVKLITKQELAKLCFPSFRNDALIHLMKERHLNYEVSKMYLEFLPFINAEIKNPKFSFIIH